MKTVKIKLMASATALMMMAGCAAQSVEGTMRGTTESLFETRTFLDTYILAGQGFLEASYAYIDAYTKTAEATNVKDATVQAAIDRFIASRSGGFAEQIEAAAEFAKIYGESDAAAKIAERIGDAQFAESWAKVLPLFAEAGVRLGDADFMQGYALGKFTGATVKLFSAADENQIVRELQRSNIGLSFDELLQLPNRIRTAFDNYDQSELIAEALEEVPNYDRARDDLKAARGDYNEQQIAEFKAVSEDVQSGKGFSYQSFGNSGGSGGFNNASLGGSSGTDLKDKQTCTQVQRELKKRGHYAGAIDGICGKGSRAAIRSFQQSEGLQPTGRYGEATKARLFPST